jgi:hypothetical protein
VRGDIRDKLVMTLEKFLDDLGSIPSKAFFPEELEERRVVRDKVKAFLWEEFGHKVP